MERRWVVCLYVDLTFCIYIMYSYTTSMAIGAGGRKVFTVESQTQNQTKPCGELLFNPVS